MVKTHRQLSREDWAPAKDSENSVESIKLGCLLRIADAVEIMAKNYNELISDRNLQKKWRFEAEAKLKTERRRNAALRGQITRIKKSR